MATWVQIAVGVARGQGIAAATWIPTATSAAYLSYLQNQGEEVDWRPWPIGDLLVLPFGTGQATSATYYAYLAVRARRAASPLPATIPVVTINPAPSANLASTVAGPTGILTPPSTQGPQFPRLSGPDRRALNTIAMEARQGQLNPRQLQQLRAIVDRYPQLENTISMRALMGELARGAAAQADATRLAATAGAPPTAGGLNAAGLTPAQVAAEARVAALRASLNGTAPAPGVAPAVPQVTRPANFLPRALGAAGRTVNFIGEVTAPAAIAQGVADDFSRLVQAQAEARLISSLPTNSAREILEAQIANRRYRELGTLASVYVGLWGFTNTNRGIGINRQAQPRTPPARIAQLEQRLPVQPAPPAGPGSVYEVFASGQTVDVYLLAEQPPVSSLASWRFPRGFEPVVAIVVPEQLGDQGPQGEWRIEWPELLSTSDLAQIWGVGIWWNGYAMLVWPLEPGQPAGTLVIDIFLALVQSP